MKKKLLEEKRIKDLQEKQRIADENAEKAKKENEIKA